MAGCPIGVLRLHPTPPGRFAGSGSGTPSGRPDMSGAMPQPLAGDFDEHRSALFDNTYNATGHFGLLTDTAVTQANLIQSSAVGESKFRDASAVWTNCQTRRCGNCSAAITAGCSFATSAIRCLTEPAMIGSGSSHVRRASRTSGSGEGSCPRHHWKTPRRSCSEPCSSPISYMFACAVTKSIGNTFQLTHSGGNFIRLR